METFTYEVWDQDGKGVQGGVCTGVTLCPGDHVDITSLGSASAGFFSPLGFFGPTSYDPEGDRSTHGKAWGNDTKPLPDVAFTALIDGFGQGWFDWKANQSFTYGQTASKSDSDDGKPLSSLIGSATTPLQLIMHINDDDVCNGQGSFSGSIIVTRRRLPGVAPV